jgi:hypothetical protein
MTPPQPEPGPDPTRRPAGTHAAQNDAAEYAVSHSLCDIRQRSVVTLASMHRA